MTGVLVIGVGNAWRGDDAAGLIAARRVRRLAPPGVRVLEHEGDPVGLLEAWDGAPRVVIVDAARSGAPPGSVRRFDARANALPAGASGSSTHGLALPDALELARALDRLPRRIELYAIEVAATTAGSALSGPVARAVEDLAEALVARLGGDGGP